MRHPWRLLALLLTAHPALPGWGLEATEVAVPAGDGAGQPFLATGPDNSVYLTWMEPGPDGSSTVRLARHHGAVWSAPRTVTTGESLLVNWADFPSVLPLSDGTLAAHWLRRRGPDPHAYDVLLARSPDQGKSWDPAVRPHQDDTPTEHGFAVLLEGGDGAVGVVWLDGRKYHGLERGEAGETALMFTMVGAGQSTTEKTLDPRVCDCCQIAAVRTGGGLFVAYRDRSPEDIRDISYVVGSGGRWSAPRTLHRDGWEVPGCPVNGPAADAQRGRVVVAWFTAASDPAAAADDGASPPAGSGRVLVALSEDGGNTFGAPLRVDLGNPAGRVDVAWPDGRAPLISWLERGGDGGAKLLVRPLEPSGLGPPLSVARTGAGRSSGFPRMTAAGEEAWIAWTDTSSGSRVRLARLRSAAPPAEGP